MPEGEDYYTKYKDILEQFPRLNQSSILQDIQQKGGYFSVGPDTNIIDFKLRIIGLNSNLWYQSNHLVSDKPDPADQFRNFEEELKSARENKERVLIFSHIPPGKFERFYQKMTEVDYSGYHWMYERFNKRYLNIIEEFWDIIELQLFAHHHTDSFKVFRGLNGTPISVGLVAPGLTPWNSTLAPETGANNPGLRLFKYSKNDGRVLDFSQFYLNLTQANEIGKAHWELEYSFLDFYNISDLSALSVASLLERMKTDDKLFNQYYSLNTVMFESEKDAEENCDATCRRYHYCAQSELDYSSFETCISSTSKGDSPSISIELISAFVLNVFLVFNSYSKIFL
ncbi:acid sphingomyelinase-like phosphodiesterase 3b [Eurytemora carolleeae]|uniref:acid sphingomyelinase-like phosphodiesterase 3b n=1 Tax=Eurytemora carolleeae TaxID=1294199 RepID=UPI000C76A15A|nr:acid sphingomyelinase-like phosphodiesterase 3b [Eurytemora carolleeae]|eukprot:XP_023341908.1 acid sphingomyelinase-like phosphodiesterase 3b [Eurytemora affinis]